MFLDKDALKESLDVYDIEHILTIFDAEPSIVGNTIVCRTICHGGDSPDKLIYYCNTSLFHCYTSGCGTFDIFELVTKIKNVTLSEAMEFVARECNKNEFLFQKYYDSTSDWKVLNRYAKRKEKDHQNSDSGLKIYDKNILAFFPRPEIKSWTDSGISKEICDYAGICYNPEDGSVLIPHYDINGDMIGIRRRALVVEQEKFGKYRPATIGGITYNHPLAFNLYGLNWCKDAISSYKTAIVAEGEKSVLQSMTMNGTKNSITVACCGSSLSKHQFKMLLSLGIKELVIGFDADFKELGDDDFKDVVSKLTKIYTKFSPYVNVSFLFDKFFLLGYKDSPFDSGKEVFEYLWQNRIFL